MRQATRKFEIIYERFSFLVPPLFFLKRIAYNDIDFITKITKLSFLLHSPRSIPTDLEPRPHKTFDQILQCMQMFERDYSKKKM